ncbi:Indole-3-glycerol phosphate synthase [hydrothermal vent metagenome]|uniref:indole-3-glycerol-phosphate synthase n=1 Tax=hydrothermal vent metagenome TaxID=652676 RepID=A0A3B0S8N8_9ZZZZ
MLDRILTSAATRAADVTGQIDALRSAAMGMAPHRSLREALSGPGLAVIAEIKRRSPSRGVIDADLDPADRARAYVEGGADAISVLTEPEFFDGSMDDLDRVRSVVDVPVLRKDFTLEPSQIWEARAGGADAVLLIVAALCQRKLEELIAVAGDVGVDAIVETHDVQEVERAVAAGAGIIGVNNRNLETFQTDLAVAERVAGSLPDAVVTIAESGVSNREGAARMVRAGYDAILVGEALVRSREPAGLVRSLKDQR